MPTIRVTGVRDILGPWLERLTSLVTEGTIAVQDGITLRLPSELNCDITQDGDALVISFHEGWRINADAGAWLCHADFAGRLDEVRITQDRALLSIRGLPDVTVEFAS